MLRLFIALTLVALCGANIFKCWQCLEGTCEGEFDVKKHGEVACTLDSGHGQSRRPSCKVEREGNTYLRGCGPCIEIADYKRDFRCQECSTALCNTDYNGASKATGALTVFVGIVLMFILN